MMSMLTIPCIVPSFSSFLFQINFHWILMFPKARFRSDAVHCIIEILQESRTILQSASHTTDTLQENDPSGKGTTHWQECKTDAGSTGT